MPWIDFFMFLFCSCCLKVKLQLPRPGILILIEIQVHDVGLLAEKHREQNIPQMESSKQ